MTQIEGVVEGQILSYACPFLIDLKIDDRPAHYRARHGSARLCFEDGAEEVVWEAYNEGGDEGFMAMYERHMATMVPALRSRARGKAIESDDRGAVVLQFLEFMNAGDLSFCHVDKSHYPAPHAELSEHGTRSMVAAFLAATD